ncbi:MAG: glycosyltransferase family 39 protein [Bacteroidales bacterium]|nr:glycosyltransferase family 39 protein [Bacteroidales bacterium]HPB04724.1 glycosyltransferase family 39 protein [Prolixibacteraceae bacterium]
MLSKLFNQKYNTLFFLLGLIIFSGLNLFSAACTELHFDEAYYNFWSQSFSFGYFDHPPMIAWLIMAGKFLFPGEIGIRIFIVLLSALSMILLWLMIRQYNANALIFWSLIFSIGLIHPYSFIATPDAPLFFFTALFFYLLCRYLKNNNFQNTILIAFAIALTIYSKYHAFLVIALVIIANLKLLKRFSSWTILLFTLLYLAPHIYWQYENDFPTLSYHLTESHQTQYNPLETINYILSELAVTGPLLGWFFLYILFTIKPQNQWEKTLKISGAGIFIFFLLATFAGDFEAHWTLAAIIPLFILSYRYVSENQQWQKWVMISGIINFVLMLALRIIIASPNSGNIKALAHFSHNRDNAYLISNYAGNKPVLFQDDWIDASLHQYYSGNSKTASLNSGFYRRNQYDIADIDEQLSDASVVVLTRDSLQFKDYQRIVTKRKTFYAKTIPNFRSYYNIKMKLEDVNITDNSLSINVLLNNPYAKDIAFGDKDQTQSWFQLWTKKGKKWVLIDEKETGLMNLHTNDNINQRIDFRVDTNILSDQKIYLMLKIGELKPLPSKCLIKLQ